ncbi:MAG: hypothetical protein PHN42_06200 [Bacilli bacterium]|nr:hypothetical protein [Bacilli bacterium]
MTLGRKIILISLDALSILLAFIEISVISLILKYGTDNNMKLLFTFIGIICMILIYKSIQAIKNEEK